MLESMIAKMNTKEANTVKEAIHIARKFEGAENDQHALIKAINNLKLKAINAPTKARRYFLKSVIMDLEAAYRSVRPSF